MVLDKRNSMGLPQIIPGLDLGYLYRQAGNNAPSMMDLRQTVDIHSFLVLTVLWAKYAHE